MIDDLRIFNRTLDSNELAALSHQVELLPEPPAVSRYLWRGESLCAGYTRSAQTNGSSVLYVFGDDVDSNNRLDSGDDFVTAEYLVTGTNASLLTLSRHPIASLTPAQSYGLASVNYLNQRNAIFFTDEPDGQVFSWTATGATNPLQRQLFSGQYAGKGWHALAAVKTLEPGEGLAGLLVDPATPNPCDVILWPPQTSLPQPQSFPQTAPTARVLPSTNTVGGLARVPIRLWVSEGNAS